MAPAKNRVRRWRETHKDPLTKKPYGLRAFARLTNVHPSILSRIESGAIRITPDQARKLAAVMGCKWHTLVTP